MNSGGHLAEDNSKPSEEQEQEQEQCESSAIYENNDIAHQTDKQGLYENVHVALHSRTTEPETPDDEYYNFVSPYLPGHWKFDISRLQEENFMSDCFGAQFLGC